MSLPEETEQLRKKMKVDCDSGKVDQEGEVLEGIDQSAHLLGNYHKYYTFHSVECRIEILKQKGYFYDQWNQMNQPSEFALLDIGCNEGNLSLALLDLVREQLPSNVKTFVVGLDIDPSLISLAREKVQNNEKYSNCRFYYGDFTKSEDISKFKQNLLDDYQSEISFSLISIFSTTMWIHINGGDEALKQFYQSSFDILLPKGGIILEPQPKKCYKSAAKRCRKLSLSYPPFLDKIDKNIVDKTVLDLAVSVYGTSFQLLGTEVWGRSLYLFSKD